MEENSSIPDTNQYTINHALQVADVQMRISLVLTIEDDEQLSLNIENEITGTESNFSLNKEEVGGMVKWLEGKRII
ncbi:MAG: hypothetical protein Q8L07_14620 [Sediminibacterium sp.]|nr:hypothetical protein [Sediminibacterium sp.]